MASERIIDLYERHARQWDLDRGVGPLFERTWLDRFTAHLAAGGTVLDIGCGTGRPIAAHLLSQGIDLVGLDASPTLIGLCRERFPQANWIVGDMRTMALGRQFAGLLAWDSFFHLSRDDQRGMFPRFAAHATPGAILMFTSGPDDGEAIGSYRGEPLYHGSLGPTEYERLLHDNGFTVLDHQIEDPTCGHHTIWLARRDG